MNDLGRRFRPLHHLRHLSDNYTDKLGTVGESSSSPVETVNVTAFGRMSAGRITVLIQPDRKEKAILFGHFTFLCARPQMD
jgi:hypothetical protein